jgi:large subunit ribosomal protein L15
MAKGVYDAIKLLGHGDIDYPITVKVNAASKSAIDKIEAAGGKVEVIS